MLGEISQAQIEFTNSTQLAVYRKGDLREIKTLMVVNKGWEGQSEKSTWENYLFLVITGKKQKI